VIPLPFLVPIRCGICAQLIGKYSSRWFPNFSFRMLDVANFAVGATKRKKINSIFPLLFSDDWYGEFCNWRDEEGKNSSFPYPFNWISSKQPPFHAETAASCINSSQKTREGYVYFSVPTILSNPIQLTIKERKSSNSLRSKWIPYWKRYGALSSADQESVWVLVPFPVPVWALPLLTSFAILDLSVNWIISQLIS
jgi:hypothetical protein